MYIKLKIYNKGFLYDYASYEFFSRWSEKEGAGVVKEKLWNREE